MNLPETRRSGTVDFRELDTRERYEVVKSLENEPDKDITIVSDLGRVTPYGDWVTFEPNIDGLRSHKNRYLWENQNRGNKGFAPFEIYRSPLMMQNGKFVPMDEIEVPEGGKIVRARSEHGLIETGDLLRLEIMSDLLRNPTNRYESLGHILGFPGAFLLDDKGVQERELSQYPVAIHLDEKGKNMSEEKFRARGINGCLHIPRDTPSWRLGGGFGGTYGFLSWDQRQKRTVGEVHLPTKFDYLIIRD